MGPYKLGAVGLGHWFKRLLFSMDKTLLTLEKGAGIFPYEAYDPPLTDFGLKRENYYQIKPGDPIPEEFFDGIDVVQIASPNRFHHEQTIQSLDHGKITITEKTYGSDRETFHKTIDYIREHEVENKTYVHLHYLNKQPTLALPGIVKRMAKNHGKIISAVGTMFEEANDEDMRRSWIFNNANGGIFMDLIHPTEVLYVGTKARFKECLDANLYMVNSKMCSDDPTGVEVWYKVEGKYYADNAIAAIRVGKGFPHGLNYKALRLTFANGTYLDVKFENALIEYTSKKRGSWRVKRQTNGDVEVLERGDPRGKTPFALMVDDVIRMIKGENPPISIDQMEEVFNIQWMFRDLASEKKMMGSWNDIREYIGNGLEKVVGDPDMD